MSQKNKTQYKTTEHIDKLHGKYKLLQFKTEHRFLLFKWIRWRYIIRPHFAIPRNLCKETSFPTSIEFNYPVHFFVEEDDGFEQEHSHIQSYLDMIKSERVTYLEQQEKESKMKYAR